MTVTQKVKFISLFIFIGFVLSILYHLYMGFYIHRGYPYNTFLFRPNDRFGDFLDIFNSGQRPYGKIKDSRGMFPMFMAISWLLYLVGHKVFLLRIYLVLSVVAIATFVMKFVEQCGFWLSLSSIIILTFCSYPVLFSLDRANIELAIFCLIFIAVILCRERQYLLASVPMGVAIALKPYSIFFLPLFLIDWQLLPIILSGIIAALLTLGSLLILPRSFVHDFHVLQASLMSYNDSYVIYNEGLYFGTSIFGAMKVLLYWGGGAFGWFANYDQVQDFVKSLIHPYFLISNLIFLSVVVLLLIYKTSFWKKLAILATCLTLLPFIGSAYRLLYLFIPLLFFIVDVNIEPKDKFHIVLFSLMMIPMGYIHFKFNSIFLVNPGETSESVLFHPALMIMLLVSIVIDIIQAHELNEPFLVLSNRLKCYLNKHI